MARLARVEELATRHSLALAIGFLFVAFVIGTQPYWLQGKIIPWDAKNHFYPMLRWLARELHEGRLPDFMAEVFSGRETLSDPQSMVTSPGFLALAALDPTPSMLAADMLVFFELFLGGVALILIAHGRGLPMLAAAAAALVFMFGGLPASRLEHTLLVQSYAFVPWVLLSIDLVANRPNLRRGAVLGVALGLLVTGRDHVAYLSLFLVTGWALAIVMRQDAPWRFFRQALPAVGLAVVLALAIALPALSASVSFLSESNRPGFSFGASANGHVGFFSLLTMVMPNVFGTLRGDYWGPGHWRFFVDTFYGGASIQIYAGLVSVLALGLSLLVRPKASEGLRFAQIAFVLTFLYALGSATPVFWIFYEVIPGVDKFRRASDAGFLVNLALALVVLGALSAFLRGGLAAPVWKRALVMAVLAALPVAVALLLAAMHQELGPTLLRVAGFVVFGGMLVGLIAVSLKMPHLRGWCLAAILVLSVADLSWNTVGNPHNALPPGAWAVQEDHTGFPRAETLLSLMEEVADQGPMRAEVIGFGGHWQNLPLALGVETTLGYNPLRTSRYGLTTGARQNSHNNKRRFGTQMTGYRSPLTDLLGVAVIGLGKPMEEIDPDSAEGFDAPLEVDGVYFYRNPRAVARAVWIAQSNARPLPPAMADGADALPDLDYRSTALVGAHEFSCPPGGAEEGGGQSCDHCPCARVLGGRGHRDATGVRGSA